MCIRDSISALQVENSGSGTNETNKVIRSVNLGSNAWANAAYHAKEHKFRISGETDTENVVLINTTGLDVASSKLLTTGRVNIQKGLTTAPSLLVGANNGGSGMNNNSTKHANICCPQYLSDTQTGGFRLLSGYGNDGNNYCYVGGNDDNITGTATHPKSATEVRIFTSATATGNGVERLRVDKDGRIIVGGSGGADPTQTTITAKGNSTSATGFSVIDLRRGEAADAVDDVLGYIRFSDTNITSGNENYAHIHAAVDKASTNASDNPGRLVFSTTADGDPGPTERLRITSDGNLYLGGTASVNDLTESAGQRGLVIGSTGMGNAGIAIINSTTGTGRIYFGDNTGSSADRNRGFINYYHNDTTNSDYMIFGTAGAEALRIQSDGNFGIGTSANIRERMHLHTASSDEAYLRFTNTGTGTGAGDGFNIGINSAEQPLIWNKEYTDMLFGTHGATRLTISKDGKATFTEVTTSAGYDLSAISATAYDSSNVVDVFVYDTSKDTDGGEWRKKCGNTSWYNETFSATRGSKKEFPAVAVIVLVGGTVSSYGTDNNTQKILIYDGDDPALPLWMAFYGHTDSDAFIRGAANYAHTSVDMFNGQMVVGRYGGYGISVVTVSYTHLTLPTILLV